MERRFVFLLLVALATGLCADAAAVERIAGGSISTISAYPFSVSVLHSPQLTVYWQYCGGALINNRSVLTVAHCYYGRPANQFRIRYGSSYANSGGIVALLNYIVIHPNFNSYYLTNDIALLRSATTITFVPNTVAAASISNYIIGDNQVVSAIGWGRVSATGAVSEQLRHVQIWTINQAICRNRYAAIGWNIDDNMLCAGWQDVGTRGQCTQDEGSPLVQNNNTVVGLYSFGYQCGHYWYPPVNTRVSRYVTWIQANA